MKKLNYLLLAAAGMMAASCANDVEESSSAASSNRIMSVQTAGKQYSRLNDVTNEWDKTDRIGISMYAAGTETVMNGATNVLFTASESGANVTFTSEAGIPIAAENCDFTAYYPYNESADGTYTVALSNQSEGYAAHDLMWAKTENVTSEGAKTLAMTFRHQLAKLTINITPNEGETVSGVTISGMATGATFNLATGEMTATAKGDITPYKSAENTYCALLLPAEASALSLTITTDKTAYEYNLTSGKLTQFRDGYRYTLEVGLGESSLGNVDEVEGGNNPYEDGEGETGEADPEEIDAVIPEGYSSVLVTSASVSADALGGKSGKVAMVFRTSQARASMTYTAESINVPESVTDLLLIGEGSDDADPEIKLAIKQLSLTSGTLNSLILKNIEIEGDEDTPLCSAQLAEDATLTVTNSYIHDVKSVYGLGTETSGQNALTAMTIENSRIYNVASVLDKGTTEKIALSNSTFYNISGQAFFSFKANEDPASPATITVTDCTLVDLKKTPFQTQGGYGQLEVYKRNVSAIGGENITWGIKPTSSFDFADNYAVTGTAVGIRDYEGDTTIAQQDRTSLFPQESDGNANFTTTVNAGDPRWRQQ